MYISNLIRSNPAVCREIALRSSQGTFLTVLCPPIGSFKIRGIGYHIQQALATRNCTHLICSSGGNAGMAVAYAGKVLNVPTTIVVPKSTPKFMIERIEAEGATVKLFGDYWDEAHAEACRLLDQSPGMTLVHPFDHPEIWKGHQTIIEELHDQLPSEPAAIMCSVGGGGLLAGIFRGLDETDWVDTGVVAVETDGAESFGQCIKQKKWIKLDKITTIAKTLGAQQVTEQAYKLATSGKRNVNALTVTDAEAVEAITKFLNDHRILVEPACSATLAALYVDRVREQALAGLDRTKPLVVFVCGGNIITTELLSNYQALLNTK